ncbi:MAG: nucleotide exchange factor GrpE [Erysipelotrichaceae bacterium]|nr:nucleotide exchange factor GrpE [Erysipelotrichaceae bacterium]
MVNETVEEVVETEETVEEVTEEKKEKKKKFFEKKNETEELKNRIAELEGECAKLKNEYLKAYADTENTRRRLQNDFDSRQKYRIQSFALDILPAIDNLERALAQKATPENESYVKGVEMIYNQLMYALNKEGVEVIEALNAPFDANWHQAVMSEEVEGTEAGIVIEVFQKGYKLKDRLLRPAMVKVSE